MEYSNIKDGNDLALAAASLITLCDVVSDIINNTSNEAEDQRKTLERVNLLIGIMQPIAQEFDRVTTEHLWAPLAKTIMGVR